MGIEMKSKRSMAQIYKYYLDLGRPKAEALQIAREYGRRHNMEGWEIFGEAAPAASHERFDPSGAITAALAYVRECRALRAAGQPTPPPSIFETHDVDNPGTVRAYRAHLTRNVKSGEMTIADAEEVGDLIDVRYRYPGPRR